MRASRPERAARRCTDELHRSGGASVDGPELWAPSPRPSQRTSYATASPLSWPRSLAQQLPAETAPAFPELQRGSRATWSVVPWGCGQQHRVRNRGWSVAAPWSSGPGTDGRSPTPAAPSRCPRPQLGEPPRDLAGCRLGSLVRRVRGGRDAFCGQSYLPSRRVRIRRRPGDAVVDCLFIWNPRLPARWLGGVARQSRKLGDRPRRSRTRQRLAR